MTIRKYKGALFLLLLWWLGFAFALNPPTKQNSPISMLKKVSSQMLSQLERNKSRLQSNPQIIRRIVDQVLVPHIDINKMAGSVVGRNYWLKSSSQQRKDFVNQFKYLVINTYVGALASYDDDHIRFYPLRGGYSGKRVVQVKSMILRKNGQRIAVNYQLVNIAGVWKIYDFSIEGVSIVQNYRSQFANTLAQGGMPMLINKLKNYNRQHDARN